MMQGDDFGKKDKKKKDDDSDAQGVCHRERGVGSGVVGWGGEERGRSWGEGGGHGERG